MKNRRNHGFPVQDWKKAVVGIGIGMLTVIFATGGFAWLADHEIMKREHMGFASAAVLALSGFLGAFSVGRGEGRLLRCAAAGAGMILILLIINLLFFDGNVGGLLYGSLLVGGGVGAAALLGGETRGRGRAKHQYRKYRNR